MKKHSIEHKISPISLIATSGPLSLIPFIKASRNWVRKLMDMISSLRIKEEHGDKTWHYKIYKQEPEWSSPTSWHNLNSKTQKNKDSYSF